MSTIPDKYKGEGYGTIYSDAELRQAIANTEMLILMDAYSGGSNVEAPTPVSQQPQDGRVIEDPQTQDIASKENQQSQIEIETAICDGVETVAQRISNGAVIDDRLVVIAQNLVSLLQELQGKTEPSDTQAIAGIVDVSNFPASFNIGNFPTTQQVNVSNFPATQPVSGAIAVSNFPATQPVSGSVNIANFPATQQVSVSNFPATQPVSGSVGINNFPATQTVSGSVSVSNFPATQAITATALPLPNGAATEGTPIIGVTIPSGGSGGTGWLSAIWKLIGDRLPILALVGDALKITGSVSISSSSIEISNDIGNPIPVSATTLPLPVNAAQEHITANSPNATRLTDGTNFYKSTTPADTQPISAASLPLPSGASQEHVTANSPHAARLSDGTTFYKATTPSDTQPISALALPLPSGAATDLVLQAVRDRLPSALVNNRLAVDVGNSSIEISNDAGNPIPVNGSVGVTNFPTSFNIGNFPATQQVSVNNFPATQPVTFSGIVSVSDIITTIQTTGFYQGKKAYYFNLLANRTVFVDNTSLHDICEFLTTAQTFIPVQSTDVLEVVSSSTLDSAVGSGARKVKIIYLDAAGNLTESADISLNGIVPVATGFTASAIYWMEVTEGGTGEVAAGNITLQRTTVGTIFERITAGGNKSLSGRLMVPKGYTGYLDKWSASAVQQAFDVRLRATVTSLNRTLNPKFLFQDRSYLAQGETSPKSLDLLKCPESTRIKISAIPGVNTNPRLDASFSIILIAN